MKKQSYGYKHKATILDYDYMNALSDDECCYSLSEREVQLLLAIIEPIGWATRYQQERSEIDQATINKWQGNLARKLMSGCCPDEGRLTRFTEEGIFQISDDGGETWTDAPDNDPRNDYVAGPPLPGSGASTKCAAADNARDQFKAIKDTIVELLTDASAILVIIAAIIGAIGFLAGISVAGIGISVLLFAMAGGILSMTPEDVETALSDEVFEQFKCILYCHMGDNGQFTYDQWLAVIAEIDSTFSDPVKSFFHCLVAAMGYIGLSNATTIGAATADDCDCGCDPEGCNANFDVQQGTIIGEFDGYIRVMSEIVGGRSQITLLTPDKDTCCSLLDIRVIEPEGVDPFAFGVHINCGAEQIFENLIPSLGLGGCYNYVGTTLAPTDTRDYVVEFLFTDCPP